MIDLWHKATQEVCAPEDYYDLSIAAPRSIWSSKLSNLPHALFERYPKLHLTIDSLDSDSIVERMAQRTLDFGFIYEPPKHSDLDVEQAFTLEMGLYSAQPQLQYQQLSELKFVCIDLGKSFRRNLSQWVPNLRSMVFQAYDWEMVASYLLEFGGYGLLPKEWVERNQLPLHPIEDTEAIRRPVYLCRNIKVVSDEIRQEFLQDLQELL
jgi:DNA-binding transcriptional LysR family regulator